MALALAICTTASIAHGQVYKCTDSAGKTTYADAACDSSGKPLKLPSDATGAATDPHVCAQLLDETHRLAAGAPKVRRARSAGKPLPGSTRHAASESAVQHPSPSKVAWRESPGASYSAALATFVVGFALRPGARGGT